MSWNYRVMSRDGEFAIHEVYYDDAGALRGWSVDPVFPGGPTLEELRLNCERYVAALAEPVLDYAAGTATPEGVDGT